MPSINPTLGKTSVCVPVAGEWSRDAALGVLMPGPALSAAAECPGVGGSAGGPLQAAASSAQQVAWTVPRVPTPQGAGVVLTELPGCRSGKGQRGNQLSSCCFRFVSWRSSGGESLPASPLPAALTLSPSPPYPTRPGQLCFCKGVHLDTTAPHLSPPCAQGLPSGRLPKWRI